MIDQHVNRYLTLVPVEQLFPVLNQISSYKTNLETLVPVPVLVSRATCYYNSTVAHLGTGRLSSTLLLISFFAKATYPP